MFNENCFFATFSTSTSVLVHLVESLAVQFFSRSRITGNAGFDLPTFTLTPSQLILTAVDSGELRCGSVRSHAHCRQQRQGGIFMEDTAEDNGWSKDEHGQWVVSGSVFSVYGKGGKI